ncbi:MAG TPA: YggT family protein [Woeseiaceae bacterium]|nr:YggT family protein [Woeseiaceae bacterium]
MPRNLPQALHYIIEALASLYILVLLLRIWLPWLRADFRNPLAQGILRLTSPLVVPLRRVIPSFGRLDTATVLVAFAIQYAAVFLILLIYVAFKVMSMPSIGAIALTSIVKLIMLSVNLFAFAILIRVILSWVAPGMHNPATAIIATLSEPVLRPLRRIIPPMGGFDLSPMLAIIGLFALNIVIRGYSPLGL